MEAAMVQMASQMTQFTVHLLQPQIFCNTERYSNNMQCYVCKTIGYISKDYPNRYAMEGP